MLWRRRDQIEPGWHAWMSYMIDKPPRDDPILQTGLRAWEPTEHRPNATMSRAAYRPYSTYVSLLSDWFRGCFAVRCVMKSGGLIG